MNPVKIWDSLIVNNIFFKGNLGERLWILWKFCYILVCWVLRSHISAFSQAEHKILPSWFPVLHSLLGEQSWAAGCLPHTEKSGIKKTQTEDCSCISVLRIAPHKPWGHDSITVSLVNSVFLVSVVLCRGHILWIFTEERELMPETFSIQVLPILVFIYHVSIYHLSIYIYYVFIYHLSIISIIIYHLSVTYHYLTSYLCPLLVTFSIAMIPPQYT